VPDGRHRDDQHDQISHDIRNAPVLKQSVLVYAMSVERFVPDVGYGPALEDGGKGLGRPCCYDDGYEAVGNVPSDAVGEYTQIHPED